MGDDIMEWAGLLHTSIRTVLLVASEIQSSLHIKCDVSSLSGFFKSIAANLAF